MHPTQEDLDTMLDIDTLLHHRGNDVYGTDGDKIGTLEEIYLDDATGEPEWALVNTGLFGTRSSFVPLQGASSQGEGLRVTYDKAKVKDAPGLEAGRHLDAEEEAELYRYYGLQGGGHQTTDAPTSTGQGTVGHDTSGPTTDSAMTRSEEELRVGTAERETGRARLRKYVVTDHVETTVPVRREEVRLEREPITDANVGSATDGPAISEEEHEVVLHTEEPVVEKRVVPKERVRLDKEVTTEEQQVADDVRKEEIVLEDDAERTGRR
jgi:uncharacterized protein (TIGR02271 family)